MTSAIHVVIPVKDRLALTASLVRQLVDQGEATQILVYDNGSGPTTRRWLERAERRHDLVLVDAAGWGLHRMWNDGICRSRRRDPEADIAILNNDLVVGPSFLSGLQRGLHSAEDLWAVSPNYDDRPICGVQRVTSTFKDGGLAGFAFMAPARTFRRVTFDEGFRWWYGDDDFVWQIARAGGTVGIVGDVRVEHVGGGSQTVRYTTDVVACIEADLLYGLRKWHDITVPRSA
jgi:GT2 family glycosyltransferase